MSKAKTEEERHFYISLCIKESYSSGELERQIESGYYERYMLSKEKLLPEPIKGLKEKPFLDSYVIDHDPAMSCSLNQDDLDYNSLFNDKVYAMIKAGKNAELIEEYEAKYRELVDKSLYMQQGVIDHNNYGNISSSLNSNGFLLLIMK